MGDDKRSIVIGKEIEIRPPKATIRRYAVFTDGRITGFHPVFCGLFLTFPKI